MQQSINFELWKKTMNYENELIIKWVKSFRPPCSYYLFKAHKTPSNPILEKEMKNGSEIIVRITIWRVIHKNLHTYIHTFGQKFLYLHLECCTCIHINFILPMFFSLLVTLVILGLDPCHPNNDSQWGILFIFQTYIFVRDWRIYGYHSGIFHI